MEISMGNLTREQMAALEDTRLTHSKKRVHVTGLIMWSLALLAGCWGMLGALLPLAAGRMHGLTVFLVVFNLCILIFDITMLRSEWSRYKLFKARATLPELHPAIEYYFLSRRVMAWDVRRIERKHKWQAVKAQLTGRR